jgi:D-beta-D-heptose 7-phosphate kinase/D-beta-D-heptose 1-phosphate adenosyltransferase
VRTATRERLTAAEASRFAREVQARGGLVVFTNGVFDILHTGHVRYLQAARALGEVLVVGVNSDRSVRAIKGPDRPINAEAERAEVLLALACVDAVVIFDEETPHQIISTVQPDVLVKGADWGPTDIIGRDVVEKRGGRVVRIPLVEGQSTTALIQQVKQGTPPGRFR